jgi:hypothetical protein
MRNRLERSLGVRRRVLFAALALTALLAAIGTSPAMAAPKGEWAAFAGCPTANEKVEGCIVARTEGGEITIGKRTVPINENKKSVITLQGGFEEEGACEPPFTAKGACLLPFVGAAEGNTLSKTPQNVPGGLLNLVKCKEIKNVVLRLSCEFFFEHGITAVTATTELAVPANQIGLSDSALLEPVLTEVFGIPALTLPVKVKLDNPLLGSECYIGSNTEPITLKLTTGKTNPPAPNKTIKGSVGELTTRAEGRILVVKNNSLVDNSFSAPGTNGCGLFGLLDPILNAALGVPSKAGTNTAILNGTLEQTGIEAARESEK